MLRLRVHPLFHPGVATANLRPQGEGAKRLRAALAYSAGPCRSPAPGRQPRAAIEACRGAYGAATNEASPGVGGVWAS